MKEDKVPTGVIVLLGCLITVMFLLLLRSFYPLPVKEEKEFSVREYLEHPEYYEIKKVYEDTTFIGYKVTYNK